MANVLYVYNAPTGDNPNQAYVGIPESVISDQNISNIHVMETEVLSSPTSSADLLQTPTTTLVQTIDGNMSVVEISRDVSSMLSLVVTGASGNATLPLASQEISFPAGFTHTSDVSSWVIYNYNQGWLLSDPNYTVLPGGDNLPFTLNYSILQKQERIYCAFQSPIESLKLYYKRTYQDENSLEPVYTLDNDWVHLADVEVNGMHINLPTAGRFMIRAVPCISGYPLHTFQDIIAETPEGFSVECSYIQSTPESFLFKFRGKPSPKVNKIEIWENRTGPLTTINLQPDSRGLIDIEESVIVNNAARSNIEIRYKRNRSVHHSKFFTLYRFTGTTNIGCSVEKVGLPGVMDPDVGNSWDGYKFKITILDPDNLLYSPAISTASFESDSQFNQSVESQEKIAKLKIIRHQNGVATDYGSYCINVDSQTIPQFLESPPFLSEDNQTDSVTKINNNIVFHFSDSASFRNAAGLDAPDMGSLITYEFRLMAWTLGVEKSIRDQEEFSYLKEEPVQVRSVPVLSRQNYNTWVSEHPKRKQLGIIPVGVKKDISLKEYEKYGTSNNISILSIMPQETTMTSNIEVINKNWKVLYYQDVTYPYTVNQIPYFTFDMSVPPSTAAELQSMEVFINLPSSPDVSIGVYHPTTEMQVVDFLGFYLRLKAVAELFAPSSEESNDSSSEKGGGVNLNAAEDEYKAPAEMREEQNANFQASSSVYDMAIQSGPIEYKIKMTHKDGSISYYVCEADCSDIPQLPEEPEDNQTLAVGNCPGVLTTLTIQEAHALYESVSQNGDGSEPISSQNASGTSQGGSNSGNY